MRQAADVAMSPCAHCSACSTEKKTEMATLTCLTHYSAIDLLLRLLLHWLGTFPISNGERERLRERHSVFVISSPFPEERNSAARGVVARVCSRLSRVTHPRGFIPTIAASCNEIFPLGQSYQRKQQRVGRSGNRFLYRDRLKGLYVVARNFFLLLLNFSAWPCLAVA